MNKLEVPNTPENADTKKNYIPPQTIFLNLSSNLYDINLENFFENIPTPDGDAVNFKRKIEKTDDKTWETYKEDVVKTDEKWNYIEINWKKCHERQKWINWFTYRRNVDYPRNNKKTPITLGFCEGWKFTSFIEITEKWEPEKSELIDGKLSEILWFDFYIANGKLPKMNSSIKDALPLNPINLGNFKKYEKWISWLCYIEFKKKNEYGNDTPCILLFELNDNWEIVWPCRCLWYKEDGIYSVWENLIAKPKKN